MKHLMLIGSLLTWASTDVAASKVATDSLRTQTLEAAQVVGTRAGNHTPMAFSNLTKKQIAAKNQGRDIPYLLSTLPSVTMSSDAGAGIGYTYLRIRGTDPTRINVTANGIPLNDAESNALYWVNMADLSGSLGSIQVQRGIGTSTNGSGAFGASVNLQTETIPTAPYLQLDASGGSYNTHKETVHFGTGTLRNHWAFNGRLTNIGSDGYIRNASANLNSYFLQGGYFDNNTIIKLVTFNGTERTGLAWNYASKSDIAEHGRRYNPLGKYTNTDGETAYYHDNVDNYHQQHYQLFWNQYINEYTKWNLAFHYTKGKGYYQQYKDGQKLYKYGLKSTLGKKSDLIRRKYSEADFYGTVFSLNYKRNRIQTILGGGWNKYDGDHYGKVLWIRNFQGNINPNQEYYYNRAHKQDANIYTRTQYEIIKGLSAYADIQYRYIDYDMYGPSDAYDKTSQSFIQYSDHHNFNYINPKAGLTYNPNEHHKIYGSWAMAHKEPTRKDYENAVENQTATPKTERMNDFELGYNFHSRKFSVGLNFYYMLYKDQFVLTGKMNQIGYPIKKNVGDSYRRGIEMEVAWKPCSWFRWDANTTWSHNRIVDYHVTLAKDALSTNNEPVNIGNKPISMSPNLVANNTFHFQWKGFSANATTHFVGKQYLTDTGFERFETTDKYEGDIHLNDYCTTDLNLNYSFGKIGSCKDLSIGCTVYNIFNKKYYANGYASCDLERDANGKIHAVDAGKWNAYSAFSAQAPTNFLFNMTIKF